MGSIGKNVTKRSCFSFHGTMAAFDLKGKGVFFCSLMNRQQPLL